MIDSAVDREWAIDEDATPDVLGLLAGHPDLGVRCVVATLPQTPPDVLHTLSGDINEYVRRGVAANRSANADTLHRLATPATRA